MRIDAKKLAAELPPWEFAVEIGEAKYPTRPLTWSDYEFIAQMQAGEIQSASRVIAFVESLFPGSRPDLSGLDAEVVTLLLVEMIEYGKRRAGQVVQAKAAATPSAVQGPLN